MHWFLTGFLFLSLIGFDVQDPWSAPDTARASQDQRAWAPRGQGGTRLLPVIQDGGAPIPPK